MSKLIGTLAVWILNLLMGFGVMIFGWGLAPVSWFWIIGGSIMNLILLGLMAIITTDQS